MVSLSHQERFPSGAAPLACACAAAIGGAIVAWHYHALGLTLTHYDARGHLVVARRIIDSITPGWQQIGAVWLPLPHLLNAMPVQVDFFYRTGASAVAMSILAFAMATGSVASIVLTLTESAAAAVAAAAVFALNPNMLYLQSTPMTEPLLLALTTAAIAALVRSAGIRDSIVGIWRAIANESQIQNPQSRGHDGARATIGFLWALACLTRYEAWPVTACALTAAVWARWRRGEPFATAVRQVARIAAYPAMAVVAFTIFSRVVVGQWFVSNDFFVPENKALHDPVMAGAEILWGVRQTSGDLMVTVGVAGAAALAA